MATRKPKLLIKTRPVARGAGFAVGAAALKLTPLFGAGKKRGVFDAAAPAEWHTAELPEDTDPAALWDMCHQLQGSREVEFAEPDLEQRWDAGAPVGARGLAAAKVDCTKPIPPDKQYPAGKPFDWRWHLDAAHSGLAAARAEVMGATDRVTIAHLDTGYREGHKLLPPHLDLTRARSFVDGGGKSAVDPGAGANSGHGMGTLGLLAGNEFQGTLVGGAPFATVVPVRVANSVVLFTNSSIAQGLKYAMEIGADVVSMSMGGVPSQLWADVVNEAYLAGVTMVTAAGNNYGPGPVRVPRFIVYPARFRRVLAACGVMADGSAYADFPDLRVMAGSYGPDSKMDTAMAAYTGNTPWATFDCLDMVRFNGVGTSSATPQVAAAAACWLQKYRQEVRGYSQKWMRVEAVRRALFDGADHRDRTRFGKGTLKADRAMGLTPAMEAALRQQPADSVSVPVLGPVLNVLFGATEPVRQRLMQIEAAQLLARSGALQNLLAEAGVDPDGDPDHVPAGARRRFMEAVAEEASASKVLRDALGGTLAKKRAMVACADVSQMSAGETWVPPAPAIRGIRVFAFDPTLGMRLNTESINETILPVPWEPYLRPGPVGEYLEVVDVDPATNAAYQPVDLNHPHLLASDGLPPDDGVPQFHQQMVYAVAMTTIQRFEDALGRVSLWAPCLVKNKDGRISTHYLQRLRIYPHALREANAYYSPRKGALLFGYFQANKSEVGQNLPGGLVFTCLSHDVVAHETTHALLDGLHRFYQHQTNPDVAAFHEGFADIVAVFQHFSIPSALRFTLASVRGDLRKTNLLGDLAQQFGQTLSGSRALRSAIGEPPTVFDYENATEPHSRGAVLLSAVFAAFLEIFEMRSEEIVRLATAGTGVLPAGHLSDGIISHLANEASNVASRLLATCIRALDFCPPVDLTFGDYLRALITADLETVSDGRLNYRTALIAAFRDRGIYPSGVRSLSESNLCWQPPSVVIPPEAIRSLTKLIDPEWGLSTGRRQAFVSSEENCHVFWTWLKTLPPSVQVALRADLGVYIHAEPDMPQGLKLNADGAPVLQIYGVRPARRTNSRSQHTADLVVNMVQQVLATDPKTREQRVHRGGCTLLIDLQEYRIRYAIRKRVGKPERIQAEQQFLRAAAEGTQAYFDNDRDAEPFAMLHRGC